MSSKAESSARSVLVAGRAKTECQMLAQWLTDIGAGQTVTSDISNLEVSKDRPGAVVIIAQGPEDVSLADSWTSRPDVGHIPVVAVLTESSWPLLFDVLRIRVRAVVVLPVSGDMLLHVLEEARRPGVNPPPLVVLPGPMIHHVARLAVLSPAEDAPLQFVPLTPREREILALLDRDFSNDEIARILVISPHTVKRHLEHLFNKLRVRSRDEAVRLAHRHGLLKTRQTDRLVHDSTGPATDTQLGPEPLSSGLSGRPSPATGYRFDSPIVPPGQGVVSDSARRG